MPTSLPSRPVDATLSVTKAARLLGVHPNTVRAWSDAGRLRYYRINPRGDRRYRLGDLQRFLAAAASDPIVADGFGHATRARRAAGHPRNPARSAAPPARGDELEDRADPAGGRDGADRRHGRELRALAALATVVASTTGRRGSRGIEAALDEAVRGIRRATGHHVVIAWHLVGERLVPLATAGPAGAHPSEVPAAFGLLGRALADARTAIAGAASVRPSTSGRTADLSIVPGGRPEVAVPIPADGPRPWGLLFAASAGAVGFSASDVAFLESAAIALGAIASAARSTDDLARHVHRADALRRVASDIGSRLDLDQILRGLVDHAIVLFEADRAAVYLRKPDGAAVAEVARNLSPAYLAAVRSFPAPSLPTSSVVARRPLFSVNYRDDERAATIRAAIVQEGYDTICAAPLLRGDDLLGLLNVYHDRPHEWTPDELATMEDLAAEAATAIKAAQDYSQMATRTAQLQSIQQLGVRLSRLTTVGEIGLAIATELRQLLDYHNVRVYRLTATDLVPVAMHGQVGEYVDETPEQLRVRLGQGITGWVAEHKVAQLLPDAAKDPRANTIPGTADDLDESMLLAPMLYEDEVLGVLVLSKLGLNQFTDDDLRLLEIYASFAAQAMANADATGRLREQSDALERQLRSQRELLQITESILTTLDPTAVFDQIADRLASLVGYDNIAIEVIDRATGLLTPLTARGIHAAEYMEPWAPGEAGIATWVVEQNEPQLVLDERNDRRVNHFRSDQPIDGTMIVVPLRGRDGAAGVLTLERLGQENAYTAGEFELVKLFAAQVSIALQNAEVHRAVEIRARTDDLTGLLNHGTFREWLAGSVARGEAFSLVMIDLDDFKRVNDELGHQAGDRFLADMSAAIVGAGRDTDRVFRYGGDEFTVILPGATAHAACLVAERLREAIGSVGGPGTRWAAEGMAVSASIGVASYPDDGATAESVLLAADRACFVAKRRGRGQIATAEEGNTLASEFPLQQPTPVDPPSA